MSIPLRLAIASLLVMLIVASALPARATTIVPLTDTDLVHSSAAVVLGRVRRIETALLRSGRIRTEVAVAVERTFKGRAGRGKILVTVPGGHVPGRAAWIFGAPEFTLGERVLLFLRRSGEGRLRTNALTLGKYRIEGDQAHRGDPVPEARPLAPFLDDVAALAAAEPALAVPSGRVGADDDPEVGRVVTARFTLLGTPPSRWSEGTVEYKVANTEAALGEPASLNSVLDSLNAWTAVPAAALTLQYGGDTTTGPSVAGGTCDGANKIQFNDPHHEVDNLMGCSGVLAVGGFCITSGTTVVNGTTFRRISEGDVTVNNGVGACYGATSLAEVMTHEIGHTIGLGHSSEDPGEPNATLAAATMYFLAHFDGRGAALGSDDVAGVTFVYPPAGGQPDADGDGVPDASDVCAGTAAGLAVDATGCACADPGHASCDDASVCTTDSCNAATAACVHTPIVCSDSDPCTFNNCVPATGCSFVPSGDGDGDGICDLLDDGDADGIVDAYDVCGTTPPGLAVDPSGCACADPGHASCADGDACTTDSCDVATGRCTSSDASCDDGDPCTADACVPASGCLHTTAGDSDGDGACDPIDACPRLAAAAPADANGDGVGDACQCTEARPGRCVPGTGRQSRRCYIEWRPLMDAPVRHGLPAAALRCADGDPACDADAVPGQCTFEVLLCINNKDPRFPGCTPFSTSSVEIRSPSPARLRDAADSANAAALTGALDLGAQGLNHCSAPVRLVVPTRGPRPGTRSFRLRTQTTVAPGQAKLRLTCIPAS